ncbi:MAG: penicillin-binding protein activator [Hyphomicrobiales bacterium]
MLLGAAAISLNGCGSLGTNGLFGGYEARQLQRPPGGSDKLVNIDQQGPKVALLLPLSARGDFAETARAMKQAAELAMFESANPGITLVTEDTHASAAGAKRAAEKALDEGAQLIVGPLLSSSLQAAAPLARRKNVPVVAFSSISSLAARGVYLMSFLPEQEVSSVVSYAASEGIRDIAALVPKTKYGSTVERALRSSIAAQDGRIVALEKFEPTPQGAIDSANRIASLIQSPDNTVQALMIAAGGNLLKTIDVTLDSAGVKVDTVKSLGTGLWDDPTTMGAGIARGGWYAGVSPDLGDSFNRKYVATYGMTPPRLASLAYDAVSMAIAIAHEGFTPGFSDAQITNPRGFQGANGLFRFLSDGRIERSLAILEVTPRGPKLVHPASTRFGFTRF